MRSRLLIGASAWLLGAVAATGGSMFAVNDLAHGLLGQGTEQLSPRAVHDDLAGYAGAAKTPRPSQSVRIARAASIHKPHPRRTKMTPAPTPTKTGQSGTLLVSKAGSVMATCQSGLAYLLYWSPDQGYQADDVRRGPAAQASLTFETLSTEVNMQVTCHAGVPVAQVSGGT